MTASKVNFDFAQEILQMIAVDEAVREALAVTGELFQGYNPQMEKYHIKHAERLKTLIEKYGFPTIEMVGEEACAAALRLILHAISQPEFMRAQETVLIDLAKQNQVPKRYVAVLMDRIRFYEGRKQIYGTNADWDENGVLRVTPIEDEARVNERRRSMDLEPLENLVINSMTGDYHPPDPKKRQTEFIDWTYRVGWREK